MFDTVILGRTCPGREYDRYEPGLRMQVFAAQQACRRHGIPLLIIVSGLESSGRGQVMNTISEWMDGKFLSNHVFWRETDEQRERPLEWRFWRCLPGKGETALFFDGWYGTLLHRRCTHAIDSSEYAALLNEFRGLEDSLALSGMIIVKLWLHLAKKPWEKRLQHRADSLNLNHLAPLGKKTGAVYADIVAAASQAITSTDRPGAPWHIIDARDANFRNLAVGKAIVETVARALQARGISDDFPAPSLSQDQSPAQSSDQSQGQHTPPVSGQTPDQAPEQTSGQAQAAEPAGADTSPAETGEAAAAGPSSAAAAAAEAAPDQTQEESADVTGMADVVHVDWLAAPVARTGFLADIPLNILEVTDLSRSLERDVYKKELRALQKELHELTFAAYQRGISSTLLFEGMDAAGKGGTIRRLLGGVDARIARVIPISSPTDEELAHHYLWRFWRHIPGAGFVTIYDRSWYGRVLVERVEGLTPRKDWSRAYAEINHFEQQLVRNSNILLKFWLHISPEEELRRFREREATPWKRHKITPEDWRNRARWHDYIAAADEMFLRTSTALAPWRIVPAEDKKYARIDVLTTWRDALKKALAHDREPGAEEEEAHAHGHHDKEHSRHYTTQKETN